MTSQRGVLHAFAFFCFFVFVMVTPTINVVLAIKSLKTNERKPFATQQALVFFAILLVPTIATLCLNYSQNHYSTKYFKWAVIYSLFSCTLVGIGYLFYTYAEYEKQQLLQAKQLELSRLNELKVKAELEVLHSKINPHFLYNALNSIADLTITDGKKARQMTIALSDLFRYTINYSNATFSTVAEEIKMAETYLQIEKIRFEEMLEYKITVSAEANNRRLPRFILQPVVENAVKHGLVGVAKKGEILVDIKEVNSKLVIKVFDNGAAFPQDLLPGYGLKIVFDKLQALYKEDYEIQFINEPEKHLLLVLKSEIAHEPVV
jgi:sensor histidine kinase YesM